MNIFTRNMNLYEHQHVCVSRSRCKQSSLYIYENMHMYIHHTTSHHITPHHLTFTCTFPYTLPSQHTYTRTYIPLNIHINTKSVQPKHFKYTHIHIHMRIHHITSHYVALMHTYMHKYTRTYTQTYAYTKRHTHAYTQTYAHTGTHTETRPKVSGSPISTLEPNLMYDMQEKDMGTVCNSL